MLATSAEVKAAKAESKKDQMPVVPSGDDTRRVEIKEPFDKEEADPNNVHLTVDEMKSSAC